MSPGDDYLDETPEWEDLIRMLNARLYEFDVNGAAGHDENGYFERTESIDLHTPAGRYPTITQSEDSDGEPDGWTVTFDVEEGEKPRSYTVRTVAEVVDLIEAN
jgi:hypothetical protein